MRHVFRFSFALLLISLAAAAPYGHRRVRPHVIHRTVPVIQAPDGQVSGRQFRPGQSFERPELPNRRPEGNRFPGGRPNEGFFPVAGSPGGIQIFPTRPNLAGQVNSIIPGRGVTLNSAANVPVSSEVLRPANVVAGTTREIEHETPSAPNNASVINEIVETDSSNTNLTARTEEEQTGSSTSVAPAPAPVTSAPVPATTVPAPANTTPTIPTTTTPTAPATKTPTAPTTTTPTTPATTAPVPVTTDPAPTTTDPDPATTDPTPATTDPAPPTTDPTPPTTDLAPPTTAPTTPAPTVQATTTPAPAAPPTPTTPSSPAPTTPAPAILNNPLAVPNTVAPGTLLQTALPNLFPMSNAAGMGGATILNGQTTATGMAMINAVNGGFGLTISIGAALTTPFGNFALGNGQSLVNGR